MDIEYTSRDEYLALEAVAEAKHEYWDGRIVALAGAGADHVQIVMNIAAELHAQLKSRGCRVGASDQRVRLGLERYVYPDVVVSCRPEYDSTVQPETLINPDLIIEVLSSSTIEADHGRKLSAYIALPSLKEYWIVSQTEPQITQYIRRLEMWEFRALHGSQAILRSEHLHVEISMQEVYLLTNVFRHADS